MFTNLTNLTHKKGASRKAQELEARDKASLEQLLQAAKALKVALLPIPSQEDYLTEVERLIERTEMELEGCSNE